MECCLANWHKLTATHPAYETLATGTAERVVIWERIFRGTPAGGRAAGRIFPLYPGVSHRVYSNLTALLLLALAIATPGQARDKKVLQYGEGLIVNIPIPEPEVEQAVEDAADNTIIRGTKEYNKDEYIAGAAAASSTPLFAKWTEGGRVFYKVRKAALNPLGFKDSADVGTLAVRYVVQPQGDKNTVLRIDALFVEDFRHSVHKSDGSVESAEYKDIQDRLASVELVKRETEEALEAKKDRQVKERFSSSREQQDPDQETLGTPPSTETAATATVPETFSENAPASGDSSSAYDDFAGGTLEQRVAYLRRQVGRRVKAPGAALKSAPYHSASTMKSLDANAEVLILITTPYWYGVETHDGDHGWLRRDQLEPLP
jgi:hypothetical protein